MHYLVCPTIKKAAESNMVIQLAIELQVCLIVSIWINCIFHQQVGLNFFGGKKVESPTGN